MGELIHVDFISKRRRRTISQRRVYVTRFESLGDTLVPITFVMGHKTVTVRELLDRWAGSTYDYYKLRGDDDQTYLLRHDRIGRRWTLCT